MNRIPVRCEGGALTGSGPVVIVIHGMSTTPEILEEGWPPQDDGLARIYWRLPVLRDGRDASRRRREHDLFRDLFWPVVAEGRGELYRLVEALSPRPVGLFGFSIGGFLSLLGAADHRSVRGCVTVGGVPSLEYLLQYEPGYDWEAPDVVASRKEVNLAASPGRLVDVPTLILHGLSDDIAEWRHLEPLARRLAETRPELHPYRTFPAMRHRLVGQDADEERDLTVVRDLASGFLRERLGAGTGAGI